MAIVERDLVGGECSFYACMPSKALLRPAELLREVARVPGAAQAVTGKLDVDAVLARRDQIVNGHDDSNQVPWLTARNIELVRGTARLDGERLLRAIGRMPLTEGLGLETVGLPAGGYIDVDDHLRVIRAPGLYAIGDVNGRSLLTHSGKYQARIAADHILGVPAIALTDGPGAPRVVFTDPQIAAVGLTLDAALREGIAADVVDLPTGGTAGASFYGRGAAGTTRFVVDDEREVLIGATFVGPEVADFLQAATIAIVGEIPLSTLAHAIAPFPSRSELWLKFFEAYEAAHGTTLYAQTALAGVH